MIANKTPSRLPPPPPLLKINENDETRDHRLKIAQEYCSMEEKQTNLCDLLAKNIYRKFYEANKNEKLCEQEDLAKIFHSIIELEKVAQLVHGQVAKEMKERIDKWKDQPYFGDILNKYSQFYKIYISILLHFPESGKTLEECSKKQKFDNYLKSLLASQVASLGNITRLDIHIFQIVSLPRRYVQLFQSYIKILDKKCKEYYDISSKLYKKKKKKIFFFFFFLQGSPL
jgi:hypothetical protein